MLLLICLSLWVLQANWAIYSIILSTALSVLRKGSEKLRELEEIAHGCGLFSENFDVGLGDLMEIEDLEAPQGQGHTVPGAGAKPKARSGNPFPPLEGQETAAEFASKYKKTLLNRRAIFRDLHEKWSAAPLPTGKTLACGK